MVLAFNFLGDTLRDALDPRTARSDQGACAVTLAITDLKVTIGGKDILRGVDLSLQEGPGARAGRRERVGQDA